MGRFTISRELRRRLEVEGWVFRSRSDTEVLLAGYTIWGIRSLAEQIDGMAAFALWDNEEKRLFLVRDRYGAKPLYLWRTRETFAFASEIKAFLKHPEFSVRVNQAALREYFTFQNLFRQHTLFTDVEHLPPASILIRDEDGERIETYWDYDFAQPEAIDAEEGVAELKRLMANAVERAAGFGCLRGRLSFRRHGLRLDRRSCRPEDPENADLHRGLRAIARRGDRSDIR